MLKVMFIQRGKATTHRVIAADTRFSDFHNLVALENPERITHPDEVRATVWIPRTDTTYTMLTIPNAKEV